MDGDAFAQDGACPTINDLQYVLSLGYADAFEEAFRKRAKPAIRYVHEIFDNGPAPTGCEHGCKTLCVPPEFVEEFALAKTWRDQKHFQDVVGHDGPCQFSPGDELKDRLGLPDLMQIGGYDAPCNIKKVRTPRYIKPTSYKCPSRELVESAGSLKHEVWDDPSGQYHCTFADHECGDDFPCKVLPEVIFSPCALSE